MQLSVYARHVAGHTALRLAQQCGIETATEYYRGIITAFGLALSAVAGREVACRVLAEVIGQLAPPKSVPRLIWNNDEKVTG